MEFASFNQSATPNPAAAQAAPQPRGEHPPATRETEGVKATGSTVGSRSPPDVALKANHGMLHTGVDIVTTAQTCVAREPLLSL